MEGTERQEGQQRDEDGDEAQVWRQRTQTWMRAQARVRQVGPVEQEGRKERHQWTRQSGHNGGQSQEGIGSVGGGDGSG